MSCSILYITDLRGKPIISRNYRGDIPMNVIEKFQRYLLSIETSTPDDTHNNVTQSPIQSIDGYHYIYIQHNNILLCAVTRYNSNVIATLELLYGIVEIFIEYFHVLDDESIRDHFVLIYELLDEIYDFGWPQYTDSSVLKEFIIMKKLTSHASARKRNKQLSSIPVALTNAVSWRAEGIKHKKNEIFLDVIEKLNLLVNASGAVIKSEIDGNVRMKSFLSGMPECKLGLNDKIVMEARAAANAGIGGSNTAAKKSIEMEDIKFHQCVRLSKFENDRTISFIPPDGEFSLFTYRLNTTVRPLIWVECTVDHRGSRIDFAVKLKSNFKRRSTANHVEISIPVPSDCDTPVFKTTIGEVKYDAKIDAMVWKIKALLGQKEYQLRASFGLPSIQRGSTEVDGQSNPAFMLQSLKKPINVSFEIPYFTVSGIQVRYLKIIEKSGYQALPWVRYITQNGDYQIRMG